MTYESISHWLNENTNHLYGPNLPYGGGGKYTVKEADRDRNDWERKQVRHRVIIALTEKAMAGELNK